MSGDFAAGILYQNATLPGSVIDNSGAITASGQTGIGIWNLNAPGTVISSSGSITALNNGTGILNLQSAGADIQNSGNINISGGLNSAGIFNFLSDDVQISNTGLITNTGFGTAGIDVVASLNTTTVNSGRIMAIGPGSVGFRSGGFPGQSSNVFGGTLINSGEIYVSDPLTETAILFASNGTDDTLVLRPGSRIIGRINMGGGGSGGAPETDTVILDHNGQDIAWRWTFEFFDDTQGDVLIVNGIPFTVERPGDAIPHDEGLTVTTGDLTTQGTATCILHDLTNSVERTVASRISEAVAARDFAFSSAPSIDNDERTDRDNGWARVFGGIRDCEEYTVDAVHHWYGGMAGWDKAVYEDLLVGLYGGYLHSVMTFDTIREDIITDTWFAGAYGRKEWQEKYFTDLNVMGGWANGDPGQRLRANNLVVGGIERISGGDASGFFVSPSLRIGGYYPIGETTFMPTATLSYAHQWRNGYMENAPTGGGQTVDDHEVRVLTGRLQMETRNILPTGGEKVWTVGYRGGLEAWKDFSDDISFSIGPVSAKASVAHEELRVRAFLGANVTYKWADDALLSIDGEYTFAGHQSNQLGAIGSASLRIRF